MGALNARRLEMLRERYRGALGAPVAWRLASAPGRAAGQAGGTAQLQTGARQQAVPNRSAPCLALPCPPACRDGGLLPRAALPVRLPLLHPRLRHVLARARRARAHAAPAGARAPERAGGGCRRARRGRVLPRSRPPQAQRLPVLPFPRRAPALGRPLRRARPPVLRGARGVGGRDLRQPRRRQGADARVLPAVGGLVVVEAGGQAGAVCLAAWRVCPHCPRPWPLPADPRTSSLAAGYPCIHSHTNPPATPSAQPRLPVQHPRPGAGHAPERAPGGRRGAAALGGRQPARLPGPAPRRAGGALCVRQPALLDRCACWPGGRHRAEAGGPLGVQDAPSGASNSVARLSTKLPPFSDCNPTNPQTSSLAPSSAARRRPPPTTCFGTRATRAPSTWMPWPTPLNAWRWRRRWASMAGQRAVCLTRAALPQQRSA